MDKCNEYLDMHNKLMNEYDVSVRKWLINNHKISDNELAEKLPFFEDGVVCPEVWFKEEFRPLFIMKEVSIGEDDKKGLNAFYETWMETRFDHVGDQFGDIRIGVNKFKGQNPWMRIVKLAYGLKAAYETGELCPYQNIDDMSFIEGEHNSHNVNGKPWYEYATANKNYISMVNQIAVVNIKKVAGGTTAKSELSRLTVDYYHHLEEPLGSLFYKQIVDLIKPSVIVFCSPDITHLIERTYGNRLKNQFICIKGYHPNRNSEDKFYNKPVNEYLDELKKRA